MKKGEKIFIRDGFSFKGLWEVEALAYLSTKHMQGMTVTLRKIGQKGRQLAENYNNVKTVPLDALMKGVKLNKVQRVA